MELGKNIKNLRTQKKLSQDELADMIYVSRQTISNWENDKNYPDIHSLLLLANIFDTSIDQMLKQDKQLIETYVKQEDIHRFKHISIIFGILLIASIVLPLPLVHFLGRIGFVIWLLIYVLAVVVATYAEKLKKAHQIQTYKEILAFLEGKQLNDCDVYREEGKRPYQKIMYVFAIILFSLTINIIFIFLLK
ncbi:MAG: helix-turn-helix transcriptional regulator [Erysipelotrichaceae bacterium]|nr:helix-turn-helix transcriptional regulator [Erysipelotrichaceae bacterium]MDY5251274.1 helix-turn-helix transcriptional regulator [Erysipelotrichaceae bacterium]